MSWVKGRLTRAQYNLIIALITVDKETEGRIEKEDPLFEQKLKDAREKSNKQKKEMEEKIYSSSDKKEVLKESENLLIQQLLNNKKSQ